MRATVVILSAVMVLTAAHTGSSQATGKTPRVGYIRSGTFVTDPYRETFLRGMRELGWIVGRNIKFEFRNYGDDHSAVAPVIDDLLHSKVDIIAAGGTPAVRAAQAATQSIPIVMVVNDPLGIGLIQSLARPGANTTGIAALSVELTAKRLELLKEMMPGVSRVAILQNPDNPTHPVILQETEPAARSLGLVLRIFEARRVDDLNRAIAAAHEWAADAVIALDDSAFIANRAELVDHAIRYRLPLICGFREIAEAGGLLSYAPSLAESWYRLATYVDKILKGEKPGTLPVEQGSKFQLIINLKSARAIGLTIPESFLLRADEVIE